ncbi:LCP family protein [Vulcanococcus sp.]|jgi:LCP family protein required for cell wall assembly|uniref:LCP family protein n=1 Tax=Vulcanococcus sp. TaxID=2856995 RepID=UPI0037DA50F2
MTSSATYPLRDERGPMLKAIALGLGAGLVLAAPLYLLLEGAPVGANHQLVNPFSSWTGAGAKQVVILGTDAGGGNTDVMYTLRVKDGVTELIQVPRDTYIATQRYGALKANALFAYGGPELVKQELTKHFGRPVEHHIVINLSVIRRLGDSLGGLEVDVPQRMLYNDNTQDLHIDLQPGRQVLRGKNIEGFLRFRHDGLGDIGRLDRQRLLLKALFDQITKPESLVRLPSLLTAAGKDMKTDLGPMEIGGLITAMAGTRFDAKRLGGRSEMRDGLSYWIPEWPAPESSGGSSGSGNGSPKRYTFNF